MKKIFLIGLLLNLTTNSQTFNPTQETLKLIEFELILLNVGYSQCERAKIRNLFPSLFKIAQAPNLECLQKTIERFRKDGWSEESIKNDCDEYLNKLKMIIKNTGNRISDGNDGTNKFDEMTGFHSNMYGNTLNLNRINTERDDYLAFLIDSPTSPNKK
jgi:hypothetical protein